MFEKFAGGEMVISFDSKVLYSPLVKINANTEINISMQISKLKKI